MVKTLGSGKGGIREASHSVRAENTPELSFEITFFAIVVFTPNDILGARICSPFGLHRYTIVERRCLARSHNASAFNAALHVEAPRLAR